MSAMYLLVMLAMVAQGFAQESLFKACPVLLPNLFSGNKVPFSMYDNFVPNTTENQNLDSVCYRTFHVRNNLYVAQMTRINTTGSIVGVKFSLYLPILPGLVVVAPGFESSPGIFTRTVLNYSGCNSQLSYSCSSVGKTYSYALGTTETAGQSFQGCADTATSLLSKRGLDFPDGYIVLPQKHVNKCVFNLLIG